MKNRFWAAAAVGLGMCVATASYADALKLSLSYEPSSAHYKWAEWAAEQVEERTEGRHSIEVFGSGQLGSEREVEESLTLGLVDIGYVGAGHMAQRYEPISIHLAAFLWRDLDHFLAYPTSDTYEELTSAYEEISGSKVIALTYFGQRHVTANEPLLTPAAFEGVKMRVPPVPIYMVFPDAAGANSTPVNFSELYLALQQGVVVAQENPLPTIQAKKFYEVQSDIMLTGHMTDGYYTLIGGPTWARLTEEDQGIISEVLQEAAAGASADIIQSEKDLVEWFRAEGINVHELDRQPFIDIVRPTILTDDWPWEARHIEDLLALGAE
ncbi:TRAP transporter substrate-binding protein DctP [Loktanella sp. Alg231-35]|uniref:TRAP transporter substrate-binding protein DctP n=1 Tax=Loktanella sp. Alg231-35 TaxID=1922220 RepID=UPI000D54BE03|nr:TRAP transporter substrate-binding protein DctP [Loktanella sp. Alg231-35]